MNKNYIESLINEMFDQNVLNSEEDQEYILELLFDEGYQHGLTGNFDEDVEYVKSLWEDNKVVEEEEDPETTIEEVVNKLHVGFNFVPGVGFGYCKDEEDLAKMREFVRGGMTVQNMIGDMFGL